MWLIVCLSISITIVCSKSTPVTHGTFCHITDLHYDPKYSQKGDPNDRCHHGNTSGSPGFYGNYSCDSSWNLIVSAINEIKTLEDKPKFILWTGDSVPHIEETEVETVYDIIGNVSKEISSIGDMPILPVLGNHDAFPSNQMPLAGKDDGYYQNILTKSGWSQFLTTEEQQRFLKGGYYARSELGPVRVVMLNTNLWYAFNKLVVNESDPNNQFAWLRQQLEAAKTRKEKVYIAAHICPGVFERLTNISWFYPHFNKRYFQLLQDYSSTIEAHFCGHEHTDSFRIVYDKTGSPSSMMFLSPAVTPWRSTLPGVGANNPGVRMFKFSQKGEILDYLQYFMNLPMANSQASSNNSVWKLEYRATQTFAISDCSAQSYVDMMAGFTHSSQVFRRYLQHNTVNYDLTPLCDDTCYRAHTCAIRNIDLDQFNACIAGIGTTPVPPPHSTTKHHHKPKPKPKPLPRYVYYIIGGMGFVIVLLTVVVSCLCARHRRRRHGIPFKYGRFVGTIN